MDQVKTGRFLAALRRERGFTQEALGRKLGVTNKTVSRWENGNYMPDIEMLQLIGKIYQISVEELLAGERRAEEEAPEQMDERTAAERRESIFSLEEQRAYWKRKWRQEHRWLLVILCLLVLSMVVVPIVVRRPWEIGLAPLAAFVSYGYQNNRMMSYVEQRMFPGAEQTKTKKARG